MTEPSLEQALATFLTALLGLAVTAITLVVIPWIKSQTSQQNMTQAHQASEWVVQAVEQNYGPGSGSQKKEFARQRLIEWGRTMGLTIDPVLADTLIEAAVKSMNDISVSLDVDAPGAATASVKTKRATTKVRRGPDGRFLPKHG